MYVQNTRGRFQRAFTLIELLTVIAIIAILAALLFPLAGTVREQARATDCMSRLHQLYVSASSYKQDEGAFPPALYGYVEASPTVNGPSNGNYLSNPAGQSAADVSAIIHGFLFREKINDANLFRCPDNVPNLRGLITAAHFPPRPSNWPGGYSYITDAGTPVATTCGSDAAGVIDCWLSGPLKGLPKYYYVHDSYDIGPRIGANGQLVKLNGAIVYDVHYSPDWTGVLGSTDLPAQLKYNNPPSERTILSYCTWHAATYGADTVTAINMAGSAKKVKLGKVLQLGATVFQ